MPFAADSNRFPRPQRVSHGETTNPSLIGLVKQGDPEAWKIFEDIYRPLVTLWCRIAKLSPSDVEDVTQNVFASVYRSIGSFEKRDPDDTFRGWLRDITQKRACDFFRSKSNEVQVLGNSDPQGFLAQLSQPEPPPETDPESRKASREVFVKALEAVENKVEPRTWRAFWRTTVDDQSAPDVAEELGMTNAAVRKAKSRMKTRLRLELGSLIDEITRDAGISLD